MQASFECASGLRGELMRRREFVAALGSAAAAWPVAARAENRVPRIGFLSALSAKDTGKAEIAAFEAGLRELGYMPGKTIEIEYRFGDAREERMRELARQFVDSKVDVIVTFGTGISASHSVTIEVPIVAAVGSDLVEVGLADSLGHPGGNVTGQTFFFHELVVKRVELLKQVKPMMTRVGLLVAPPFPRVQDYLRIPKELGVERELIEVAEPGDCDRALSEGPGATIEGLAVPELLQFVGSGPAVIAAAAAHHGLPAAGGLSFGRNGGLLSFGVDMAPMTRRAAVFVDKILKGAKPGDIPIEQATKFITFVNLKSLLAVSSGWSGRESGSWPLSPIDLLATRSGDS